MLALLSEEVERIELAFLRMIRRLEAERRRAGSAALRAQEEERARVARDLHDEVNQSLTGLLLRLEAVRAGRMPFEETGAQELLDLVPRAELVDVAGAGHMVAGDRNDAFNDAIVDFVHRVHGDHGTS